MITTEFETNFTYRFKQNWALRNILHNYFVYWRGGQHDPETNVEALHQFIVKNATFNKAAYHGIGEMLMIDEIFDEEHKVKKFPGIIPSKYVQFIEGKVNEEYGLNELVDKQYDKQYTVAQFLWNIFNAFDKDGRKSKLHSSKHMSEIVKKLFDQKLKDQKLKKLASITEVDGHDHTKFLVISDLNNNYRWSFLFVASDGLIDERHLVFDIHTIYEEKLGNINPDSDYPTICGTYFGHDIKFFAKRKHIKLVQISSLFKLFQGITDLQKEGFELSDIVANLDLIPKDPSEIMSVGRGLKEIRQQLSSKP